MGKSKHLIVMPTRDARLFGFCLFLFMFCSCLWFPNKIKQSNIYGAVGVRCVPGLPEECIALFAVWWQRGKNGKEAREETEGKSGRVLKLMMLFGDNKIKMARKPAKE